jgi:hypothetical protein
MSMAVFWVVALCSLVEVYWCFRGACCIYHEDEEAASTFESSVYLHQTTRCSNPEHIHLHTHCHENLKSSDMSFMSSMPQIMDSVQCNCYVMDQLLSDQPSFYLAMWQSWTPTHPVCQAVALGKSEGMLLRQKLVVYWYLLGRHFANWWCWTTHIWAPFFLESEEARCWCSGCRLS